VFAAKKGILMRHSISPLKVNGKHRQTTPSNRSEKSKDVTFSALSKNTKFLLFINKNLLRLQHKTIS
jgi:hypothetical protein